MKQLLIIIFIAAVFISCSSPAKEKITLLTAVESFKLDSMQFDKTIVFEIKQIVDTTFQVVKVENRSGKIIPERLMSKMVQFDLNYLIDEEKFEEIKSKNKNTHYNIYKILQENKTSIIISKL